MHRTSSRAVHKRKAVLLWLEPNYGSGSMITGTNVWKAIHTPRAVDGFAVHRNLNMMPLHACSAPSFGRSLDRNEAVTVLAQQKATAHRSLDASVVFVPTAHALRVGPIPNSVRAAVILASFALRYFVI